MFVAYAARIPSFLRLLVLLSLGLTFFSWSPHQLLWNPLNLPSKWLPETSTSRICHRDYYWSQPKSFSPAFLQLAPSLSSFLASIYSNLLTIRSPVCSESCSLFILLQAKLNLHLSLPGPGSHQLCSCCSPCPPHPLTHITAHPYSSWTGRRDLTAAPLSDGSARYLCVS